MHIGIDFDNTIVNHDSVFYKYALREQLITPDIPATKHHIGAAIKKLPHGNTKWTELQGEVYGRYIRESTPMPGVRRFLKVFNRPPVTVSIVSHRTQYPVIGPKVDLRRASLNWLKQERFFTDFGLTRERVYFADTLDGKIRLIGDLGFDFFIDDLELVLLHKDFPKKTSKIYLNKHVTVSRPDIMRFASWKHIGYYFEKLL